MVVSCIDDLVSFSLCLLQFVNGTYFIRTQRIRSR